MIDNEAAIEPTYTLEGFQERVEKIEGKGSRGWASRIARAAVSVEDGSLDKKKLVTWEVEQLKNKMKLSFGGTRKDLEAFFASLDKDRNHVLEFGEVADGLRGHMSRPEVLYIWKLLDINGDGLISVDEFVDFFEREDDV